jgi:hypothetical protein
MQDFGYILSGTLLLLPSLVNSVHYSTLAVMLNHTAWVGVQMLSLEDLYKKMTDFIKYSIK